MTFTQRPSPEIDHSRSSTHSAKGRTSCVSPQVKAGPSEDEIHQAHLDSIKVIQVEAGATSLPQEPTPTFLTLGLGSLGSLGGLAGLGGLAALSIPLLEPSGSAPTLQGLSQRDALSLLSLQPFQTGFLLQPDGGAATGSTASSGTKPREGSGSSSSGAAAAAAGVMELADIQQILKVAAAAPNQMGLTLPALAKTPVVTTGQGGWPRLWSCDLCVCDAAGVYWP